jgi:hypothetical protein
MLRSGAALSATWQRFFRSGGSCIIHLFVRSYTDQVNSRRGHEANSITTRYGERMPVGGEIFCTRQDRTWRPPSILYKTYRVFILGVKRPGRGVDHPPHLLPRLRKEYSYTSTPHLGFAAFSRMNFIQLPGGR